MKNLKSNLFLVFLSVLIFKLIDSPNDLTIYINNFFSLFSPFFFGLLIALILNPCVNFFNQKLKINNLLSILISIIIAFLCISFVIKLIFPLLIETLNILYKEVPKFISEISEKSTSYFSYLPLIEENLTDLINKYITLFSTISNNSSKYLLQFTSILLDFLMGIVLSIYILHEKESIKLNIRKLLYATFSKQTTEEIIEFFNVCHNIFYHYIIGKILDSLIIGVLAFLGFKFLIRIENSLFLAFIVFLTNIIPYFGPFIGAILPIFMTLTYSPIKALWILIFIILLQQLDGNLIGPKILGDQVGLSPFSIICAVLIGWSLFGFLGVFLSIPITAILKYLIQKYINKRLSI